MTPTIFAKPDVWRWYIRLVTQGIRNALRAASAGADPEVVWIAGT
jgi:hypothetical protein